MTSTFQRSSHPIVRYDSPLVYSYCNRRCSQSRAEHTIPQQSKGLRTHPRHYDKQGNTAGSETAMQKTHFQCLGNACCSACTNLVSHKEPKSIQPARPRRPAKQFPEASIVPQRHLLVSGRSDALKLHILSLLEGLLLRHKCRMSSVARCPIGSWIRYVS